MDLGDVSERLLTRSQEAILQLDLWIHRQRRLQEESSVDKGVNGYCTDYMAQLNSLYVRSEYVRDKLISNKSEQTPSSQRKSIEDLVFEFYDITLKLNELARQDQHTIASSTSETSEDSFKLRPMKIVQRCQENSSCRAMLPVGYEEANTTGLTLCHSLPGSPGRLLSTEHSIRGAKSLDVMHRPPPNSIDYHPFKKKNRISINFLQDDHCNFSDQETMISISIDSPMDTLIRRCNSHESILSMKLQNTSISYGSGWMMPRITASGPRVSTIQSSARPVLSKASKTSKELLASFISSKTGNNKESTTLFSKLGLFSTSSSVVSETGMKYTKTTNGKKIGTRRNALFHNRPPPPSCSTLTIGPNNSAFVSPLDEPLLEDVFSIGELQEALKTTLN